MFRLPAVEPNKLRPTTDVLAAPTPHAENFCYIRMPTITTPSMSLQSGTHLAHYEILSAVGAGGMGEVYRARDSKLGREVAIKTLPEELAGDKERLARFDREARLLASLNHPKIATLHGLEEANGTRFLVMELVEGETLGDRLKNGPLPLELALDMACQVAEALEAAHEKGVIHRDLKPGNIMVSDDDRVKVLDFGLAKALAPDPSDESAAELSLSPTMSKQATLAGVILGTASYMSPEQARGKRVDKRADIFAFGSVLYEMLTGRKAFGGEDLSDTLASVIKLAPDWETLPPGVPPRVRELLHRCLEKDPKARRRDIGDVRVELEALLAAPNNASETTTTGPAGSAVPRPNRWPATVAAALAFGLLTGLAAWTLRAPGAPPETMVFEHVLPEGQSFSVDSSQFLAVSPDGKQIVYAANDQLYMRSLDALEAVPIRGTEGDPRSPFFSPDGQWIGFAVQGELRKVPVHGGASVELCTLSPAPYGPTWTEDGRILYGLPGSGIMKIPEAGGTPEVLVASEKGKSLHGPQMLPGGQNLLFTRGGDNWEQAQIVVRSLASGNEKTVVAKGTDARYTPTGHLIYAVENTIFAVSFDVDKPEVTGVPVPVIDNVRRGSVTGGAQLSLSDSGVLAYVPESQDLALGRLVWVDRSGQTTSLSDKKADYAAPRLSPDGTRLAVEIGDDLWIHEIDSNTSSRFTSEDVYRAPVWSHDGASLSFAKWPGRAGMLHRSTDFSSPAESSTTPGFPYAWTTDGKHLLFGRIGDGTGLDIWTLPRDGEARPLVVTPAHEGDAALSPDGNWLAFTSNESGQYQIYVQPFPGPGRRWPVSTKEAVQPVWSPRGGELFYVEEGERLMAIDVSTDPDFRLGEARILFEKTVAPGGGRRLYDVSPDGQRFVMVQTEHAGGQSRQQINLALHWFQELERLVPSP